ncbi:nucleoside deaminase [Amycolatopsis jiangsuensis]|uniref:tRNA(Arg) A34 adenosine deaminase TadA n=1 Tax=Amycolatopsis jiangsuensis TaxID=1181879 RepID=A0A840J669_9PSEU|nr:nucleoside deaminase [Amycolatopsis jiangsuensis]MBB4688932.1 tRNA(Arg) A34 adenosine deaminase TadA [Amycolatopsis jiangsuensis]
MTVSLDADLEHSWLQESVRIATRNVADGGGPFGALVVRDGEIIATGVNRVTPTLDPTAHAEVVAIRAACQALGTFSLTGCVLVSSCEPCPMCLASSLWARVDRVLYAADRHDAAKAGFDDRAFYELFETPRDTWEVPVARASLKDHFAPFDAWLSRADRIEY